MNKPIFKGAGVAIVTPMKEDFSIDYDVYKKLLDYQIENGTDAIIVTGTTGEAATLTIREHLEIIEYTVDYVKKQIPVIAGVGSNNTAHAVELSKEAQKIGVDGLLHVTPYYNKTSQKGLVLHFEACAKASDLPIIIYNVPSRTGVNICPNTYQSLSKIDTIVGVKEASGNLSQVAQIASEYGDRFDIYSGNDDQIVPILSLGGKGVISVLSNILPKETHLICQNYFDGNIEESKRLQLYYLDLVRTLFSDVNPIPVKQALRDVGYSVGSCRLPLCDMDDCKKEELKKVLLKYHLL